MTVSDVDPKLRSNAAHKFASVNAIIFLAPISAFDQVLAEVSSEFSHEY
jgi:hypothetical protein